MTALVCSESLCSFPVVICLHFEENLDITCTILIFVMSAGLPCITGQLRPEQRIRGCSSGEHRQPNQHEKFHKAAVLTSEMVSAISVSSNVHFQRRIRLVKDLIDYWKRNEEVGLVEVEGMSLFCKKNSSIKVV